MSLRTTRVPSMPAPALALAAALISLGSNAWAQVQILPHELLRPGGGELSIAGHPTEDLLRAAGIAGGGPGPGQPLLPDPPLATGPFVNFESPAVKPLAFDAATQTLVAVNTPNNSVVVFSAATDANVLTLQREIPVGLDPVSVAFQPGTNGQIVFVANHLSDSVSQVDLVAGQVTDVSEVGDEPVNILFNSSGTYAFVVLQEGKLVSLDTTTLVPVGEVILDGNTPRVAVYDPANERVIVAALHSGNNTTVIGAPFTFRFDEPCTPDCPNQCINNGATCRTGIEAPVFGLAIVFSLTAALFESTPMSPWPSVGSMPNVGSPPVLRITTDKGVAGPYQQIVDLLSDDAGNPDPAMVSLWLQEWLDATGQTAVNIIGAFDLLIREYADTLDHDLFVIDVSEPAVPVVSSIVGSVGTTLTGMGRNPVSGRLFVSNMEPRNLEKHVQSLRGHVVDHQVVILNSSVTPTVATRIDLHAGVAGFNNALAINVQAQRNSLANPLDIVFNAAGTRAYLAALGPSRVAALNGTNGAVLSRAAVGRGPRGLALNEAGQRLYVLNRTDQTISIVDVSTDTIDEIAAVPLFNPEPPAVRRGRDFLYSTKFSNNYATACATCHIDSNLDHLGWDLGNVAGTTLLPSPPITVSAPDPCTTVIEGAVLSHPVKGPMVTQSLRGLADHAPFHWRGDKPEFVDFNEAFDNLLGGNELTDEEMGAFDAFIKTVTFAPNPNRNRDNSFKNPLAAGGIAGYAFNCQVCHESQSSGTLECAGVNGDVAFMLGPVFQTQLVPQLRQLHRKFNSDLYNGFGLLHDGHEKRERNNHPIETFLIQFFPGLVAQAANMIAFLEAFPTNVAPVVGWQVLMTAPEVAPLSEVVVMIGEHQMSPSRCDVVAKGISGGQMHGYWLASVAGDPPLFEKDDGTTILLTDLAATATPQNPLIFTAVPPGSGQRIGVDQDTDGFLDALDFCPQAKNNGDVNHDDKLDFFDIDPFLLVLFSSGQLYDCAADVNSSGFVDFFDIDPFLDALFGG